MNEINILVSSTRQWNPGDEFILYGVQNLFKEYIKDPTNWILYDRNPDLFVDGYEQSQHKKTFWTNAFHENNFTGIDLAVIAGTPEWFGKPLELFYRLIRTFKIPLIVLGAGYYSDEPIHFSQDEEYSLLSLSKLVTVRDRYASKALSAIDVPHTILPCPGLFANIQEECPQSIQKIGFILQCDKTFNQKIPSELMEASYSAAINTLKAGFDVEVISFYIDEFIEFSNRQILPVKYSYNSSDILDFLKRYDVIVSTRLHGAIAANSLGKPAILLNKDPRCHSTAELFPFIQRTEPEMVIQTLRELDIKALREQLPEWKSTIKKKYIDHFRSGDIIPEAEKRLELRQVRFKSHYDVLEAINEPDISQNVSPEKNMHQIIELKSTILDLETLTEQNSQYIRFLEKKIYQMEESQRLSQQSSGWLVTQRIGHIITRLFPLGSRRYWFWDLIKKAILVWAKEGFLSLVRDVLRKLWNTIIKPFSFLSPTTNTMSENQQDENKLKSVYTDYTEWVKHNAFNAAAARWQRLHSDDFNYKPCISLLLAIESMQDTLFTTLQSLQSQTYPNWELVIAYRDKPGENLSNRFNTFTQDEPRIKTLKGTFKDNTEAWNRLLSLTSGELIGIIDQGDRLEPAALFEIVYQFNLKKDVDLVYSDEDILRRDGSREQPVFKPDYSVDIPREGYSIGRLWIARKRLIEEIGGFQPQRDHSSEYVLLQKLIEKKPRITSVKSVLYSCSWSNSKKRPPLTGINNKEVESGNDSTIERHIIIRYSPWPILEKEQIKRILVLELDHLGDVLLTFPAMKRLRQAFPDAEITVLVGPWAKSLLEKETFIDKILTYSYYQAKSAKPHRFLNENEKRRITEWLSAFNFDLAIDLRRFDQSREFLRFSRARYTAGYANAGEYDWLTISLPYDQDIPADRPRRHIAVEKLALVELIATSARDIDTNSNLHSGDGTSSLPDGVLRQLSNSKLVIGLHPGAGLPIRCWPIEYFALLADLFIEKLGAAVLLFGGKGEEEELCDNILQNMLHKNNAISLAGKFSISEFAAMLKKCDLFVGNNSGPAHIAASMGIPTLGIYGGTNDSLQWTPAGPEAISVQLDLKCMPCFLAAAPDCPYEVACLKELKPEIVYGAALRMLISKWSKIKLKSQTNGSQS